MTMIRVALFVVTIALLSNIYGVALYLFEHRWVAMTYSAIFDVILTVALISLIRRYDRLTEGR